MSEKYISEYFNLQDKSSILIHDIASKRRFFERLYNLLVHIYQKFNEGNIDKSVTYLRPYTDTEETFITVIVNVINILFMELRITSDIEQLYNILDITTMIYNEHIRDVIYVSSKFLMRKMLIIIFSNAIQMINKSPNSNRDLTLKTLDFLSKIMSDLVIAGEDPYFSHNRIKLKIIVTNETMLPNLDDIKNDIDKYNINNRQGCISVDDLRNVIVNVENTYKEYVKNVTHEIEEYMIPDLANISAGYYGY